MSPELPPRVGRGLIQRAALAALAIVLMSAGAVSAAGFLQVDDVLDVIKKEGRAPIVIPEITEADAGEARTIMILGSDERYGDKKLKIPARSDTILLARLDPKREAIALMSIPRDLQVDIPGRGKAKINEAYTIGGPRLVVKTVSRLLSTPQRKFEINHVVNVNFGGFRRAVDYLGCAYVDIDRDYFNDKSTGENYATIDIDPGYQKVCGRDALDYVRYRHTDNDLVRAARQQDFLRQLKSAAGVRKRLNFDQRKEIAKIFGRYADTDKTLRKAKQVFSLLKLGLFIADKPIQEVQFKISGESEDKVFLFASENALRETTRNFFNARVSGRPRGRLSSTRDERKAARKRSKRNRRANVPGLEIARKEGEDQAIVAVPKLGRKLPFYFPTLRYRFGRYAGTAPRIYSIRDEQGKLRRAYRLVVKKGNVGEYYGIQGLTWRDPPILDGPHDTERAGGRKLLVYYDGRRVRLVAWRTPRAVYYVHNTLLRTLSKRQMLAIAGSLRRLGRSR